MLKNQVIGVDLGGTNARAGIVREGTVKGVTSAAITSSGTPEQVLEEIFAIVDEIITDSVEAIGIGAPSLVDMERGIVYDVQNIPSWKEVRLGPMFRERYGLPVLVNNDANCFALGEYYFGKGQGTRSMVGLTVGTGLGAGIIIDGRLYSGSNCGAGEFGMVEYLDRFYEFYACGQFFQNVYGIPGEKVFERARSGDARSIQMFNEMGTHLGNAIKMILYTYDPELIIMGGSVRHAWPFFQQSMWERIRTLVYPRSVERLRIAISELENSGILGAAALHYDFSCWK